jgi:hypothetical protein
MVLPRFSRYSRSPVLIPRINSRVKIIMSQTASSACALLRRLHYPADGRE